MLFIVFVKDDDHHCEFVSDKTWTTEIHLKIVLFCVLDSAYLKLTGIFFPSIFQFTFINLSFGCLFMIIDWI